jgi:hypothetical protein
MATSKFFFGQDMAIFFLLKSQKFICWIRQPPFFFWSPDCENSPKKEKKTLCGAVKPQARAHWVWYNGQGLRPFHGIKVWGWQIH